MRYGQLDVGCALRWLSDRADDDGDDLGIPRDLEPEPRAFGDVGNERGRAAALADQQALVRVELVLGDETLHHGNELVARRLEHRARRLLDAAAEVACQRREGKPRRRRVAVGVQAGPGVAKHVGSAGHSQRVASPARHPHGLSLYHRVDLAILFALAFTSDGWDARAIH